MSFPERQTHDKRVNENLEALVFTILGLSEVRWRTNVDYIAELPVSDNQLHDLITVYENGYVYYWDGSARQTVEKFIKRYTKETFDLNSDSTIPGINGAVFRQVATPIITSLPASPVVGDSFYIYNDTIGGNTINGNGNTISGEGTQSILALESFHLFFNGTERDLI